MNRPHAKRVNMSAGLTINEMTKQNNGEGKKNSGFFPNIPGSGKHVIILKEKER